mgnify:CR=1 FL=1
MGYALFNLLYGLYKMGGSEAGGSPWSECENDGSLVAEIYSIVTYRTSYARQLPQGNM